MSGSYTTHVTLLERLADERDAGAWREFHDRYSELIRSFARRRGLQAMDCDDVLQDVLAALMNAMPGFEYDPARGKFRSYLKTVTLHAIYKKTRQKPGGKQLPQNIEEATRLAAEDEEIEQAWEQEWREHHLRQALKTISVEFNEADRLAFERYAVEGESAQTTAETLGLSVDQVYQAKSRIARRLSELIAQQVADEG